ncbi:hypothetical protein [Catenulispora rubra]|uniref:hypothetical protein n=1 Tax=Catenulispora rubra TaxID=280293 RepID=UPI00189273AD|nr:hypothetical protein [Catenulispora rubra]
MDQRDQQPQGHDAPGPQPYYGTQWAAAPQHPTVRRRTAIGFGIGALIVGAGIGAAGHSDKTTATAATTAAASAATATATVTTTQTAPAPAAVTITAKAAAAPAAPTVTVTATATAAAPTSAAATGISEGTYVIGTDIKPGLYKTSGPVDTGDLANCYWERDRDLSGGMGSIIANDNTTGPTTVQISSSDKAFKTSGCAPWVKVG